MLADNCSSGRPQSCHASFGCMVIISVLLHFIASVPLLQCWDGEKSSSVRYLDLKNIDFSENVSVTKQESVESEESGSIPEIPEIPASPPEQPSEAERLQEEMRQLKKTVEAESSTMEEHSLGLGLTSGYFSSFGEGETLRDDIREYYLEMLRRINETWWRSEPGRTGKFRAAVITVVIGKNGSIISTRFVEKSGNPDFDRSIMQSLQASDPLPALPETYQLNYFIAPLRFVAPLKLFNL